MTQSFRLGAEHGAGRLIDRHRPLHFSFDGRPLVGLQGDTLASALLAAGVRTIARSFKYHRRRGVYSAGTEEPHAIVQIGEGARAEPNIAATQVPLFDGLVATSQNRWPSLDLDFGAMRDHFARFMPAGFYYKTFMWPSGPRWWLRYEHLIRRAAGMGIAPALRDPDSYEHRFAHCDLLVVGAGAAGLAAARAAVHAGARVILVDESAVAGGRLLENDTVIDGQLGWQWAREVAEECRRCPDATVLLRTTAFGSYDQNLFGLMERRDGDGASSGARPRCRLWKVRAREVVLATGAVERPIAFPGNDVPGVMLTGAISRYALAYGVTAGRNVVLFGNHDGIHDTAMRLHAIGIGIKAVVDARAVVSPSAAAAAAMGLDVYQGHAIVGTRGRHALRGVEIARVGADGRVVDGDRRLLACDAVGVSGGWNPAVHLFSQRGGRLRYDDVLSSFVPSDGPRTVGPVGAALGAGGDDECLRSGHEAALAACQRLALPVSGRCSMPSADRNRRDVPSPLWIVRTTPDAGKAFVDLQNDVTAADVGLAAREGYRSVEHLKRYTTLGMGTDQGKTSNVTGLALLAEELGVPVGQVGTTTFRPPYTPVPIALLAGRETGAHAAPVRLSPMHGWHVAHGARFVNTGLWKRAQCYPDFGEGDADCIAREVENVRTQAGIVDVSTLGKIELQGPDAVTLLERVYVNRWSTLPVGHCRYGLMLRDDGFVLDDGTTARLSTQHFLMTTTTAHAARVLQHLEFLLQTVWPTLNVHVASVTEQWAAMALAGPRAREVLARVCQADVSDASIPFLALREIEVAGVECRVLRITYSGELAYEIHAPSRGARHVWEAVIGAGQSLGLRAYGTEAMGVLRIEKGHVTVGAEIDGRTTADDLGLGRMVAPDKDFIGRRSLLRPALTETDRWQLVGLVADDVTERIPPGAKLLAMDTPSTHGGDAIQGHVTSTCWSPTLRRSIALALLASGRRRHGETLRASAPLFGREVVVRAGVTCFVDPQGLRARG